MPSSTRLPIEALNDPQVKNRHENLGLRMPEALDTWQKAEIAKGRPIIKAANVKVD